MSSTGLRHRRPGLVGFVENLDSFSKVTDEVKEEKKATAGFISFVSFTIIAALVLSTLYDHFLGHRQYDYRFAVDTDMTEQPLLKMDLIVASPCNALQVMSTITADQDETSKLSKDPTRFDFTDEEQLYWTILRHAHAKMHSEGLRGLEDLEYVSDDVEDRLSHLQDVKQAEESVKIDQNQAKDSPDLGGQIVFMIGNGGMFQMVATSSKDEGTACRIHGNINVRKGKNEKIFIALNSGLFHFHAHDKTKIRNVSHRIEQFHFGPRISGLVSPLAGAEQISTAGHDVFRYFLKIVPTKIYHGGLLGRHTLTYQYSVTFLKKEQDSEHDEGGIYVEYEFSATVIEIRERVRTFTALLLRLCAIIGGVFATSQIINSLIQSFACLVNRAVVPIEPLHSPIISEEERTRLINASNILVH